MTNYEKYQLQWMIDHNYSLNDLMKELNDVQYDELDDDGMTSAPVTELFKNWESDVGFGSEIWACKDEWEEYEGHSCL